MKKILALILCVILAVSLASCASKANDMAVEEMEYYSAADSAGGTYSYTSESYNGKVEFQSDSVPSENGEAPQKSNEKS